MLCPVQFHPVFAARIFLDTALPVLAAPHSLPALIPECAQPAFCLNREESHVSIRQIIVRRASTRRAPAIASWPRARLRLTPTRGKEEQKPDSDRRLSAEALQPRQGPTCRQFKRAPGIPGHVGCARGLNILFTSICPLQKDELPRLGDQRRYRRPRDKAAPDVFLSLPRRQL